MTFALTAPVGVCFAEAKSGRVVAAGDIAKTVARRATEDERWRYGVELRIAGSRWRPQKLAPHYPVPQPYVYRKAVHSLTWSAYQLNSKSLEENYEAWLAEREASKHRAVEAECVAALEVAAESAPAIVEGDGVLVPAGNVVPLRSHVSTPAREAVAVAPSIHVLPSNVDRRQDAAVLLREIAETTGPRRAHKLLAIADWLVPATG